MTMSVCLSVCMSVAYVRFVWKLSNQSTWKFRTVLGPWKAITGCSIMMSSQIQDGGRPPIMEIVISAYLSEKWSGALWLNLVRWIRCDCDKKISRYFKIQIYDRIQDGRWTRTPYWTRNQAVTRIADRTTSQHLWGHVMSSVTWRDHYPTCHFLFVVLWTTNRKWHMEYLQPFRDIAL